MSHETLTALARSFAGPFAFCGIAVSQSGAKSHHVSTAPGITAGADSPMRVASVSKVITGRAFEVAARKVGLESPYLIDIADLLGWNLHHPMGRITAQMLLSHAASLADHVVPTDAYFQDWISHHDIFLAAPPGSQFSYSNLGYVIIAAAIERMTDTRFDLFATEHVIGPMGLAAGFNWSGIEAKDRAQALPIYRRSAESFVPQVDASVPNTPVICTDGSTPNLAEYLPGLNPAIFAPQGGLRVSLAGMLTIAEHLKTRNATPLWTPAEGHCVDLDGVFEAYGAGLQIFDRPRFYPRPLIGHFGNAYGFNGGVWYDRAKDRAFAYVLNGLAEGDEDDAFSDAELRIFQSVAALSTP